MAGLPQEALLATAQDQASIVEERRGNEAIGRNDADRSGLLDDEQAAAAIAGVDDVRRRRKSADDFCCW